MCNASDRIQLSSSRETGWNEWTIAQVVMTESIDTVKEESKEKEKEQEKDYYPEWG